MILAKKIPLCAKKNRMSRKEGETQRKKSLCGFATLRLRVNKKRRPFKASCPAVDGISGFARKKNIPQRRGAAKKEIPLRLCGSAPSREQKRRPFKASYPAVDGISGFARKKNIPQRRGDAKKEIPLRLCCSAPSREQKKEDLPKTLPCRRRSLRLCKNP